MENYIDTMIFHVQVGFYNLFIHKSYNFDFHLKPNCEIVGSRSRIQI